MSGHVDVTTATSADGTEWVELRSLVVWLRACTGADGPALADLLDIAHLDPSDAPT